MNLNQCTDTFIFRQTTCLIFQIGKICIKSVRNSHKGRRRKDYNKIVSKKWYFGDRNIILQNTGFAHIGK